MRRSLESLLLLLATAVFTAVCVLPLELVSGGPPYAVRMTTAWGYDEVIEMAPPPAWLLPLDDAYIFIRYAQQAARGRPLEWNDGEPSSGASSFVYPWLLVPGQWLAGDLAGWSRWSRLVGLIGLWLLGLAAAAVLRRAGLGSPWPLCGGVAVIFSGPVGVTAVGGMESALNAAAILTACAWWMRAGNTTRVASSAAGEPGRWRLAGPALVACLPLVRPENGVLTAAAVLALWLGGEAVPRLPGAGAGPLRSRLWAAALLLPGLGLAALYRLTTGSFAPAGAKLKSWLSGPHATPLEVAGPYVDTAVHELLPLYLGLSGPLLWPPVGWLAAVASVVAVAGIWRRRRRGTTPARWSEPLVLLAPLAVCWLLLVALAPASRSFGWQAARHHQAGLACAWVLAVAALAVAGGWAARWLAVRSRRLAAAAVRVGLPLLVVALPAIALPHWSLVSLNWASVLHFRHAPALAWLGRHARGEVLLTNDAGLPALVHDGPAVDLMGLGTPGFAAAFLHRGGALAEALARRRPLPAVAAVNLDVMRLPELLGPPLVELRDRRNQTLVAPLNRRLLAATVLAGPGVDLAHLPDEDRWGPRWSPPLSSAQTSVALVLAGADGEPSMQGCRPLLGWLELELPAALAELRIRAAPDSAADGGLTVAFDGAPAPAASLWRPAVDGRWGEHTVTVPAGARRVRFDRRGPGPPCLESVAFLARQPG